jgi:DNA-binding SARP family transcriptional activator
VPEVLGVPAETLNDDRLGRALDAMAPHLEAIVGSIGAGARAARSRGSGHGLAALAANLVASITLLSTLLPTRMAVAAPLSASVAAPPPAAAAVLVAEPGSASEPPAPAPEVSGPASTPAATYQTGARDSWWSIAETTLGDGLRWSEVRDLNVGRTMADGHVVTASDQLLGRGWTVLVPTGEGQAPSDRTGSVGAEVVVEPGDTLWDIAAEKLDDPFAWTGVYEANAGVVQPDGDALRDPDHIHPGWRLSLRAESPAASADAGAAPASPHVPAAGEGPENVRADAGVVETPARADAAAAAPKAAEAPRPSTPRRDRPLRAPSRSTPAPPAVVSPGQSGDVPSMTKPGAGAGLGAMAAEAAAKVAAVGIPVLAATGVVLRLGLLRALQHRRRRPQRGLPRPDAALEPVERHLRAIAADEMAEWVELVMRLLTLRIGEAEYPTALKVVVLRAGEFGVEVMLDQPCSPPPEGFEVDGDARVWRLVAQMELDQLRSLVASAPVIAPALVTLGMAPALITLGMAPEGPVLVDLETLGVLSVEGDEERVRAFLAGVALELATARWSELELGLLDGDLGVTALERGPSCRNVEELVARVRMSVSATSAALGQLGSTTAARVAEADADPWPPVVAVVGPDRVDAVAEVSRVVGAPGRGGAVVAAGPVRGATWRLAISGDGRAVLSPLGLEVDVTGVDVDAVTDASGLLEVAAEEGDNAPLVDLTAEGGRHHRQDDGEPANGQLRVPVAQALGQQRLLEPQAPGDVYVQVLGRSEVTGCASPAGKKSAEIVAYLAVHDGPVPIERLRSAIWPLSDNRFAPVDAPQTMKSAMYRTRRALGVDADGNPHLPHAKGGLVGVGPKVRCDWREFRTLVRQAQHQPRPEAMASLRSALELVCGAPFSYVGDKTYGWASSEHLASDMEIAIGDAAHRLCELALAHGEPDTAMWATRQGLLASPGQEALIQDRMTAAAAGGDAARLRAVYQDAQQAVRAIDPLDELSAETEALYEQLTARVEARGA